MLLRLQCQCQRCKHISIIAVLWFSHLLDFYSHRTDFGNRSTKAFPKRKSLKIGKCVRGFSQKTLVFTLLSGNMICDQAWAQGEVLLKLRAYLNCILLCDEMVKTWNNFVLFFALKSLWSLCRILQKYVEPVKKKKKIFKLDFKESIILKTLPVKCLS